MKKTGMEKLEAITSKTLIVGIDIAKNVHWAQLVDYRGIPIVKAIRFENNRTGFEHIVAETMKACKAKGIEDVLIGMEPTGPYWKALACWLKGRGYHVVGVNTYHTKRIKELDDNSPTKNDKKDALVIARLVKDGRYFDPYLPDEVYGELRVATNSRAVLVRKMNDIKNRVTGILDEYFPEYKTVFKYPFKAKTSIQILLSCPFPGIIMELGEDGVLTEIKKAVKKSVGKKRAARLVKAAKESVGVSYGIESARWQVKVLTEELIFLEERLKELENRMRDLLEQTGYAELLLGIDGIGVVSAASFLGEVGDPMRFKDPRQISRMAGYNLVENSSGQSKSGTRISKRGRKSLRALLYRMAVSMVANNNEIKKLYDYLKNRKNNPLKKNQALIVVSKKIITIIYRILKTNKKYDPVLVLGQYRKEQIRLAA